LRNKIKICRQVLANAVERSDQFSFIITIAKICAIILALAGTFLALEGLVLGSILLIMLSHSYVQLSLGWQIP